MNNDGVQAAGTIFPRPPRNLIGNPERLAGCVTEQELLLCP